MYASLLLTKRFSNTLIKQSVIFCIINKLTKRIISIGGDILVHLEHGSYKKPINNKIIDEVIPKTIF